MTLWTHCSLAGIRQKLDLASERRDARGGVGRRFQPTRRVHCHYREAPGALAAVTGDVDRATTQTRKGASPGRHPCSRRGRKSRHNLLQRQAISRIQRIIGMSVCSRERRVSRIFLETQGVVDLTVDILSEHRTQHMLDEH